MRVVVAMSGGVDSAVSASLLQKEGHEVIGVCIKSWPKEHCGYEGEKSCYSPEDARSVAFRLGIPFYVVDYEALFREKVVNYFISEYTEGRTPNPCIPCNEYVKFGALLQKAREMECTHVATGHYARLLLKKGQYQLYEARDSKKDQSYVLFSLSQEKLRSLLFPLGEFTKEEVRQQARRLGLRVAEKAESQDACFLREKNYRVFLEEEGIPSQEGEIVDEEGMVVGHHSGVHQFTVGQRSGLGIARGRPMYVTQIDPKKNRLVVGTREALAQESIWVDRVNWVSEELKDKEKKRLFVKIRYRNPKAPATVQRWGNTCQVSFEHPAYAATPGQACVFYEEDMLMGGGWIRSFPAA